MSRILTLLIVSLSLYQPICAQHDHAGTGKDIVVAVFLGVDCPISQKYIGTLNSLYGRYKDRPEITWHFIVPEDIRGRDVKKFSREYNAQFPIVPDGPDRQFTTRFGATITPQAVVLLGGKQHYTGAIDDWFYALGKYRNKVTAHYLIEAIEASLSGTSPAVAKTEAIGCFIQGTSANAHHHDM
jgi:hypothetical protein